MNYKAKFLVFVLLVSMVFVNTNTHVTAQTPDTLNDGDTLTKSVNKKGGTYFIYLDATSPGVYTLDVEWPTTVSKGQISINNDIEVTFQDRNVGIAAGIASLSYDNKEANPNITSQSLEFVIYQEVDTETIGLIVEYEADNWEDATSTADPLTLELSSVGLSSTSDTVSLTTTAPAKSSSSSVAKIINLADVSAGLYNLSFTKSGDVGPMNVEVDLFSYPDMIEATANEWSPEQWQYVSLPADQDVFAEVSASFYNNNETDSTLTVDVSVSLDSISTDGSLGMGDHNLSFENQQYQIYELPSLVDPLEIDVDRADSSHAEIFVLGSSMRHLTDLRNETYTNNGEISYSYQSNASSHVLFESGVSDMGFNWSVSNLVEPIPEISNVKNINMVSHSNSYTFNNVSNRFEGYRDGFTHRINLDQSLSSMNQLIGETTYLVLTADKSLDISLSSATVENLNYGTSNSETISNNGEIKLYEMDVSTDTEILRLTGDYSATDAQLTSVEEGEDVDLWTSGDLAIVSPLGGGETTVELYQGTTATMEVPVYDNGTYYVIPVGNYNFDADNMTETMVDIDVSNTLNFEVNTDAAPSQPLNSTTTYNLGVGNQLPTSQIATLNVEEAHNYQITVDSGVFSPQAFGVLFFTTIDGQYPFKEIMPAGSYGGFSHISTILTATQTSKVYMIAVGFGQITVNIVDLGITTAPEEGGGFSLLPAPSVWLMLTSFVAIFVTRRKFTKQ